MVAVASGCASTKNNVRKQKTQAGSSGYLKMIQARQAEDSEDTDTALKLYGEINNPYAWLSIARIYSLKSDDVKASEYLNKVLDSGEYLDDAIEQRVNILVRQNKTTEAISEVEKYSAMYPQDVKLKVLLAKLKLFVSDFNGAIKILSQLPPDNDDIESVYILARACIEVKDMDCAVKSLEKVIEMAPDFPQAYIDLGKVYESEGNYNEAIKLYSKLAEVDPESKEAYLSLADLYIITGRNKDAILQLKMLVDMYPNRELVHKLAILEIDSGMFTEAIEILKSQKEPTPEEKYYMSIAYAGQKDYANALMMLDQTNADGQLRCDIAILRSSILDDTGKHDEAFAELKSAWGKYSKEPSCREIGYRLATALEEKGKAEEGVVVAQSILDIDPHDAIMLNFVGYIWADKGKNLEKAKKMIGEALSARPDDGYILDSMGWALFKSGNTAEAASYLEKALKKYPDESVINEHMGDIQLKLGNKKKALEFFLKAKSTAKKGVSPELEKKIDRLMKKPGKAGKKG
jgi:tetratricopeptide (TPR) repeat protein